MEFDNSFEVPLPPAQAWPVLMDIRRVAPCMPGAELTEVVDDKTYKGRIGVRLGPVAEQVIGVGWGGRVLAVLVRRGAQTPGPQEVDQDRAELIVDLDAQYLRKRRLPARVCV